MTNTPALMVLGTGSHVGKSLMVAALCRIFSSAGLRVSPFKAQNMSLNSAVTPEGLEIGRAQALQAEAASIPPSVHMNPILLKPSCNTASQVIVRGKIFAQWAAEDYFCRRNEELVPMVRESYEILAAQNDLIILEGAGSPAEINLKDHDIVNLRMARIAGARCILVGDIDRGGVFASLFGTLALLEPSERDLIDGFIINKFRGDIRLLFDGVSSVEERIGKPCLGIVPYLENLRLDEEDAVSMERTRSAPWRLDTSSNRPLRVAVVRFPSISNFTDFDPLIAEPSIDVRFCRSAEEVAAADLVILPGSKQTMADLCWMYEVGIDKVVRLQAERGIVVGICGGMQMLGSEIDDLYGVEAEGTQAGLRVLPIRTKMNREKTTREATGELIAPQMFGEPLSCSSVRGYEIHVGETEYLENSAPFARIHRTGDSEEFASDGCTSPNGRVVGTYLHGIFHEDAFRHAFLRSARKTCGLPPPDTLLNWKQLRENEFERLARTVSDSVDPKPFARPGWLGMAACCGGGEGMRVETLSASYLLDWVLGDPESFPHPVRFIGKAIATGERALRRPGSGRAAAFMGGLVLTSGLVAGSALAVSKLLSALHRLNPSGARAVEIWLGASCLATRNLVDEANSVLQALEGADLERARLRLSRIVGRDTTELDTSEIARAVIETLGESLCDGVIAPLTYLAVGGVPMAMAYKAVNTLDSMIGHRDEGYEWFGKAAARLDDAANFVPARMAALLVCGACAILEPGNTCSAWRTWWLDGLKHASPNAGQTESAMAGALRVQLGGVNTYGGERVDTPLLGAGFAGPEVRHVRKALHITAMASLLGFAVACIVLGGRRDG